jgi:signal transduction histidine kinase
LATASPFDAALRDVVHRLQSATNELDRQEDGGHEDGERLAEKAVELALGLTHSTEAALCLGAPPDFDRVYSLRAAGKSPMTPEAVGELLESAGVADPQVASRRRGKAGSGARLAAIGEHLHAGAAVVGVMAVGRPSDYSEIEVDLMSIFATHVARAIEAVGMIRRQHALESALLDARAKLEQVPSEGRATAEQLRTAERVERAHELAVQVLLAVSSHAVSGQSLSDFYRRLARTVGELVGAEKVLFWRLTDGDRLAPISGGYGVADNFLSNLGPTHCDPEGDDLASRVVFKDLIFRANAAGEAAAFSYVLERLGVSSAISVPWRAGQERLGLLAAYDSTRQGGFSREDTWVLQKAGLAAGLVTQLWHTQEDLRKTVERLSKVDAARQLLLRNMTTVVEKERKRFVSELHDDALQKLTAAEIHLSRLAPGGTADPVSLEAVTSLLEQTEAALRRLVFEVHPPSLETSDGLARSIRDRLSMLSASGIKHELVMDLPEDINLELKSMIFRQMAEAIGNVERHSKATFVKVAVTRYDGGVLGVIEDDGQGFVVAERSNLPGHLGLLALKERTLMAGGRYKIESHPGAGTRVEFWVPFQQ